MKLNYLVLFLLALLVCSSCGREENAELVDAVISNCYDEGAFGPVIPERIDGLPQTCMTNFFTDLFDDDDRGWREINDNDREYRITGGRFRLESKSDNNWYTGIGAADLDDTGNYQISAWIRFDEMRSNSSYASLYYAEEGALDYAIEISINKARSVQVRELIDKRYQPAKYGPVFSNTVLTDDYNKLTVRVYKGIHYFFVNNVFITSVQGLRGEDGSVGFSVPSRSEISIDAVQMLTIQQLE